VVSPQPFVKSRWLPVLIPAQLGTTRAIARLHRPPRQAGRTPRDAGGGIVGLRFSHPCRFLAPLLPSRTPAAFLAPLLYAVAARRVSPARRRALAARLLSIASRRELVGALGDQPHTGSTP